MGLRVWIAIYSIKKEGENTFQEKGTFGLFGQISRTHAGSFKTSKIKTHTKELKSSKILMRPLKAIQAKCLECSGDSPKEVTLRHLFDCSLWEYRFGYSIKTTRYKRRMKTAMRQFPKDLKELTNMGINIRNFFAYDKNNS